jgi:hypothetical protein
MPPHWPSLVGVSLLAAACSAEPSSGPDSPSTGGAGSAPGSAGATTTGGSQAGQSNQAGQTASSGGTAGSASGSGGAGGSQSGAGSGGSAGSSSGSAGSSGSGPHAGDGCVPGGSGFDASVADVVVDRSTCLVWERKDPPRDMAACELKRADVPSSLCFTAAQAYCEALRLDGQSDWRLPSVSDLQSLIACFTPAGGARGPDHRSRRLSGRRGQPLLELGNGRRQSALRRLQRRSAHEQHRTRRAPSAALRAGCGGAVAAQSPRKVGDFSAPRASAAPGR